MKILGIDPSLNNFGYSLTHYDEGKLETVWVGNSNAPPDSNKRIRKNCADLERCRTQQRNLRLVLEEHQPDLVAIELPVGSKSARSIASYGMCLGIISAIDLPTIEVLPGEVKVAACGSKTASKGEMIAWAEKTAPDINWVRRKGVIVKSSAEHAADSMGAVHAAIKTEEFKSILMIQRMMREKVA